MFLSYSLLGLLYIVSEARADNWAVLVAGSNGWGNYRHQADICHAYQVLKDRGFSMNNVITMMYDDIAFNVNNPMKGQIINEPYGPNVYENVKIDYKAKDVTPQTFLNVLRGNETAMKHLGTGRVLKSGPEDNVFIFFVDHGGVGLLCFPDDNLYADDLEHTLQQMYQNKQFKKLLFFVDACESGSMFNDLLKDNENILALTGAARDESSKGCYCGNPQLPVCLGDVFGVTWAQHMDKMLSSDRGNEETLWSQYNMLRNVVNQSHVEIYGDISISQQSIDNFFGKSSLAKNNIQQLFLKEKVGYKSETVANWEAELHAHKTMYERAPAHLKNIKQKEIQKILQNRRYADTIIRNIFKLASKGSNDLYNALIESKSTLSKQIYPCYKNLVQQFNHICFNTAKNYYLLRHLHKFVNVCSLHKSEIEVIQAMKLTCNSQTRSSEHHII